MRQQAREGRRRRRESEGVIFGKRFEGRLLQESELVERRSNLFAIDVVVVKKREKKEGTVRSLWLLLVRIHSPPLFESLSLYSTSPPQPKPPPPLLSLIACACAMHTSYLQPGEE